MKKITKKTTKTTTKKLTKKQFQKKLDDFALICLERSDEYFNYNDEDLLNASLIFMHIFGDVMFTENDHLNLAKKCELAKTAGEAFRELIKVTTGKNMPVIVKKVLKK